MISCKYFLMICSIIFGIYVTNAQGLRNLRKAKEALKDVIYEKEDTKDSEEDKHSASSPNNNTKKTLNTRMSSEEILRTLDNALDDFNGRQYSSSRYNIQQALMEIEIQMGEQVLDQMPKSVRNQEYDPDEDKVISTGAGFIGLDISRNYPSEDGMISANIANNAAMLAPYNMALSNPSMVSQDETMKAVTVNDKRGILELDEYNNTFKLVIPFGQTSVFMLECESCMDESEVLGAAGQFDLDSYLEILGETPVTTD